MYSEQLISKKGPLGYVWLAANYDKKLTKQQLLNTSIIQSSEIIGTHPVSYSSSQSGHDGESITLRVSGQLLLGIARIYSRKTKYLLDDVNEILLKLKNSFRYASGGIKLGSDQTTNLINVEPQQTVVSNIKSITLQDQVTGFDLLYQEDLNLDDDFDIDQQAEEDSFTFDRSIEAARFSEPSMGNDMDLELDFGTNISDEFDRSVEVGRDASTVPPQTGNQSILDELKGNINENDAFDFDFDAPLDTVEEPQSGPNAQDSEGPEEPSTPPPVESIPRRRRTGITEDGELVTNKRKLQIDSVNDMDGIAVDVLRDNQESIMNGENAYISMKLSESEKLQLIQELANPSGFKKRKIWDIDAQLQERCQALSEREKALEMQHNLQFENDYDDYDDQLDFDLSLPDLQSEDPTLDQLPESNSMSQEPEEPLENTVSTTIQIADILREEFDKDVKVINLSELIEKDLKISETTNGKTPLGMVNKDNRVSKKREATRCFFELLVLATNDCISISQDANTQTAGGDLEINLKDSILNRFL